MNKYAILPWAIATATSRDINKYGKGGKEGGKSEEIGSVDGRVHTKHEE